MVKNIALILLTIALVYAVYLNRTHKCECTHQLPNIELLLLNERKDAFKRAYMKARAHYDSLPTKTEILTKYDTIYKTKVDSVLILPDSVQRSYIITKLERLYKRDSLPN